MKEFVKSVACRTRAHCLTCRDRECGRPWRLSLLRHFALPVVPEGVPPTDFECPFGIPWNVPKSSLPKYSEEEIAAMFEKDKLGGCGCSSDDYRSA